MGEVVVVVVLLVPVEVVAVLALVVLVVLVVGSSSSSSFSSGHCGAGVPQRKHSKAVRNWGSGSWRSRSDTWAAREKFSAGWLGYLEFVSSFGENIQDVWLNHIFVYMYIFIVVFFSDDEPFGQKAVVVLGWDCHDFSKRGSLKWFSASRDEAVSSCGSPFWVLDGRFVPQAFYTFWIPVCLKKQIPRCFIAVVCLAILWDPTDSMRTSLQKFLEPAKYSLCLQPSRKVGERHTWQILAPTAKPSSGQKCRTTKSWN